MTIQEQVSKEIIQEYNKNLLERNNLKPKLLTDSGFDLTSTIMSEDYLQEAIGEKVIKKSLNKIKKNPNDMQTLLKVERKLSNLAKKSMPGKETKDKMINQIVDNSNGVVSKDEMSSFFPRAVKEIIFWLGLPQRAIQILNPLAWLIFALIAYKTNKTLRKQGNPGEVSWFDIYKEQLTMFKREWVKKKAASDTVTDTANIRLIIFQLLAFLDPYIGPLIMLIPLIIAWIRMIVVYAAGKDPAEMTNNEYQAWAVGAKS